MGSESSRPSSSTTEQKYVPATPEREKTPEPVQEVSDHSPQIVGEGNFEPIVTESGGVSFS